MAEISGVQKTRRRSTYQQLLLFTGSTGEIAADMTFMRLSIHDGATAGGWFGQKGNVRRLEFPNTGLVRAVIGSDAFLYVHCQNVTSITLPLTGAAPPGQTFWFLDYGNNSGTVNIGVNTATSTEKMMGWNGTLNVVNSTSISFSNNGNGFRVTPLSTAGVWAIW